MTATGLYPATAPASGGFPLATNFTTAYTAANFNSADDAINYAWEGVDAAPLSVKAMTTGSETYTISGGTVTQINGTTIDGVTIAGGDIVFVPTAPTSSGVGTAVTSGLGSSSAANGVYYATAVASNITLARVSSMSSTAAQTSVNPAGRVVYVRPGGTANGFTMWQVSTPSTGTFLGYGSGVIQFQSYSFLGAIAQHVIPSVDNTYDLGSSSKRWRNVYGASFVGTVPNASNPQAGINTFNVATQSQPVVSGTTYYMTSSGLTLPASFITGMVANRTALVWRFSMAKTAAGTGTFQLVLFRGTNGTTADTADVTQTLGTQTAVVDSMTVDVVIVITVTGASGSYYWSISPIHQAATAAGFGIATGATGQFSNTKSTVALNTASLIFGLGFICTTGTPTITVPMMQGKAYNLN